MAQAFIRWVGKISTASGTAAGWLCTALVLLICYDVFMKNVFNYSNAAIFELQWHLFALIFLLGASYTLQHDRHVRVDVFYSKFTPRQQDWVNLLGILLFLIPFCLLVIDKSWLYARNSFLMHEKSPDPGGLPYRFLTKGAIILGFSMLLLQGIALALGAALRLFRPKS
jgi:TRAP-type mannitol/chloroaromatic compound transport system permease small subunit